MRYSGGGPNSGGGGAEDISCFRQTPEHVIPKVNFLVPDHYPWAQLSTSIRVVDNKYSGSPFSLPLVLVSGFSGSRCLVYLKGFLLWVARSGWILYVAFYSTGIASWDRYCYIST